jgi:hypothetical protein
MWVVKIALDRPYTLMILAFLSWRSTVIIGVSIPPAILSSVIVLSLRSGARCPRGVATRFISITDPSAASHATLSRRLWK